MELILKNEVYTIVGCCIKVCKILGYGFSEVVYKDALEQELLENEIPYKREMELPVYYKSFKLKHSFNSDFTIFDSIIVEVKAGDGGINEKAFSQTLNYMKASGYKIGLIFNFGKSKMDYKRLIM